MITGIPLKQHRPDWQAQMAQAISDPAELLSLLGINPEQINIDFSPQDFRMKVPMPFVERMQRGNPDDPLLLQVLSRLEEQQTHPGFERDPVGDLNAMASPGLIHKYDGRALLVATGACAVHCRYCFRRHFPYGDANLSRAHWEQMIAYLKDHPEIHEIILSGGDPLSLPDHRLQAMIEELETIPHIQRLRIHTRLPVVIPDRVSPELTKLLDSSRLNSSIVLHINHPQEIDSSTRRALDRLRSSGVCLLNQAVLLRSVNDNAEVQITLSETLFEAGVLPYYLHLLDPVEGASHFDSDTKTALEIIESMRKALPGYLVPRLVREIAGKPYKTPIA